MGEKVKRKNLPDRGGDLLTQILEPLRLSWALLLDNRVSILLKLIPVAAFAFLVSPLDLAMILIPVIGWLADIAIVLLAIILFNELAPAEVVDEHLLHLRSGKPYQIKRDKEGTFVDVKAERVAEPEPDTEPDTQRDSDHDTEPDAQPNAQANTRRGDR